MFGKLKEKIKNWTKKISEEKEKSEEIEVREVVKKDLEKKKVIKELKEKEKPVTLPVVVEEEPEKKRKITKKFNAGLHAYEQDLEKFKEEKLLIHEIDSEKKPEEKIKEETEEEVKPGTDSFFKKIKSKVSKIKISEKEFEVYAEELEMLLLENNVALEVTEKIVKELKEKIVGQELLKKEIESEINDSIKEILREILIDPYLLVDKIKEKQEKPYVILFCGINGTGKTTTIAKIAEQLKRNNISSVIAAADTFRAASIEQIKKHGDRLGIKVISQNYGSDPASVGFDAIKYAKKNKIDAILIDTAGRMHTAKNLLKEIEKIVRVCNPDLKIFVGESITGNDAIEQVRSFDWSVGIDGIILTKADIDEKGGTALSVGYVTKKPILYLGTGQEYDAIEPFDKQKFIEKLGL